jgi:nucleoside-diphosphate-sugar epimerase
MSDSRTALVTGATGFIGRHLTRRLLDGGWDVKALIRGDRSPRYLAEGVKTVVGDLTRPSSLKGAVTGCDVVFHTACAAAGTFAADRDAEMLFMRVNRDGTEAIGREAAAARARFIHLSSTAAMGLGHGSGPVDEETPENPISPYGRSKLQAEHALRKLRDGDGLDAVVLRPCMTAGPGKRGGEIRKLVKMAGLGLIPVIGGSEDAIKPIVYVDDLVDAMLLAFEKGTAGRTYLIHDGARHTLMEIVEAAGRVAGNKRPFVRFPARAMRWTASSFDAIHQHFARFNPPLSVARLEMLEASREISIDRAKRELGYGPRWTDVEEMLRLSV